MNKKFATAVRKLAPNMNVVDHYFFEPPVDHILRGFLCEKPSSAAYFWMFAFPLYDNFKFLHLGFAKRLPGTDGFLELERGGDKEIAIEFVNRMARYRDESMALGNLDRFAQFIECEIGLGNPGIRRGFALTLIMLGRSKKARKELEALIAMNDTNRPSGIADDADRLICELDEGIDVARNTLLDWESETKRKLALLAR